MKNSVIIEAVWAKWRQFEIDEDSPGFFLELLEVALSSSPPLMQDLLKSAEQSEVKKVIYCSHTLKSCCQSLGALTLAEAMKSIEIAARGTPPKIETELVIFSHQMFEIFIREIQKEIARIKAAL
jgi:HPt (histidine-containing phosphotransfer) domain-containing protein